MEIDLASTSTFANGHPWEQYAWLRANDPVHWHPEANGPGFWAVTEVRRRPHRQPPAEDCSARTPAGVMMAEPDDGGLAAQRQMMLTMDPPQHDRFKLLVSRGVHAPQRASARAAHRRSWPGRSSTT